MLYHLASHLSTPGERESEESECEESENEESESEEGDESELMSHSQRDLVAQEVGVMHQVSYFSSVSTFRRIKDRNYKSGQQHIFTSFSFSGKNGWLPLCSMSFPLAIFPSPPKS